MFKIFKPKKKELNFDTIRKLDRITNDTILSTDKMIEQMRKEVKYTVNK